MAQIPLKSKMSSLFDIPDRRDLQPKGSSLLSFAWDPHEEHGRRAKKIAYENTYKMEPLEKFRPDKVKPIIEKILNANLEGRRYDPIECSILSKALTEDLRDEVKTLDFQRYKIVCHVIIGQKNEQGVQIGSRFLWDAERDNFAASSWSNKYIYAVGTVYAVYYE